MKLSLPGLALAFAVSTIALAASSVPAPAQAPTAAALPASSPRLLASICYHRFGEETRKDPYKMSLARLGQQLDYLRSEGWRSVSLTQVAAALDGHSEALPSKGVLLSVDDGYKAGADGAAAFEKHGFRAVYFVCTGSVGGKSFSHWDDLRDLESRGFEVACHSDSHPNLAKVPKGFKPAQYREMVINELGGSKARLEKELGHPVTALAWPFGAYDPALADAARRLGYRQMWSVSGGLNDADHLDALHLRRILLMGHPPLKAFKRHLSLLPVEAAVEGLSEGDLVYAGRFPLTVTVRGKGVLAAVGTHRLKGENDGDAVRFTLPTGLKWGFHYLTLDQPFQSPARRTPLLFQVASEAWKPHFSALSTITPSDTDHAN